MPGGSSNPNRGSGYGGNRSSGGKSSGHGSNDYSKGHYYREHVTTVGEAAIRLSDAKVQVNKTETGTKERHEALEELSEAQRDLDACK